MYQNMMHLVKSTVILSELEQAKLTLITENTFDIRYAQESWRWLLECWRVLSIGKRFFEDTKTTR